MTWEVDWSKRKSRFVWARNRESGLPRCRVWHWVESGKRYVRAGRPPIRKDTWEVDENRPAPTGCRWARNPNSRDSRAKPWHVVSVPNLRLRGVELPTHRNEWEFDWSKRKRVGRTSYVWGRNPGSRHPRVREWTWIARATLHWLGVQWQRQAVRRSRVKDGYVYLNRGALTPAEAKAAKRYGLLQGYGYSISEHRLVASIKYKRKIGRLLVRHRNGNRSDNRPSNLLLGSSRENTADHCTALKQALYWRERCRRADHQLSLIRKQGKRGSRRRNFRPSGQRDFDGRR